MLLFNSVVIRFVDGDGGITQPFPHCPLTPTRPQNCKRIKMPAFTYWNNNIESQKTTETLWFIHFRWLIFVFVFVQWIGKWACQVVEMKPLKYNLRYNDMLVGKRRRNAGLEISHQRISNVIDRYTYSYRC